MCGISHGLHRVVLGAGESECLVKLEEYARVYLLVYLPPHVPNRGFLNSVGHVAASGSLDRLAKALFEVFRRCSMRSRNQAFSQDFFPRA